MSCDSLVYAVTQGKQLTLYFIFALFSLLTTSYKTVLLLKLKFPTRLLSKHFCLQPFFAEDSVSLLIV